MSNVQFDEGDSLNTYSITPIQQTMAQKKSFISRLLTKIPGIKTESQVQALSIVIIIVFTLLSLYVLFRQQLTPQEPTYIEDIPEEIRKTIPQDVLQQLPSRTQKK